MRGFRAVRKGSSALQWGTNKALSTAVTRGLDPRVHLLRIDFANVMDARGKPTHDNQVDHLDGEPL